MEKRELFKAACGVYRVKLAVEHPMVTAARQRREEMNNEMAEGWSNEDSGRAFRFGLGALSTAGLLYWLCNRRKNEKTEVEDALD